MRVPLSWLRDFAPFDLDPVELGETFDDLGMVVEGLERIGEGLDGVVVARVIEVRPHPKADRVCLTAVDIGDGGPLQVVCGAPNVAAGQLVALAPVGTVLPGDFQIGRRQVRGEWSEGMICSAKELALGDDADGIMVLSGDLDLGTPLAEALGITTDVVYDLAIEGNRPDANSVAGVARDAAARLKLPFAIPTHPIIEGPLPVGDLATISVEAPDLCPRFTARAITDVVVGPSPTLVARRLALAGMRSINNVVDASNYVMLELGQPTHPYDLQLLPGRGLMIRRARPGEVLVTLDGTERALGDGDDCLICDATGVPVGIAGIMGGASSEISAVTTSVLLEAAYFNPMAIARTSKRLALRTEASARFERGCDPEVIPLATDRFCSLLGTGAVAAGMLDERTGPAPQPAIGLRTARVNAILGTDLADEDIRSLLTPLGFHTTPVGGGLNDVIPPSFRPDAGTEIDLVEEVARHHGYSRIPRTVPRSPYVGRLTPYQRERRRLREILAGAGVSEAVSSPLLGPGDNERAGFSGELIGAVDPLARDESILRASLLPSLLKALRHNASHQNPEVQLFEIGHVFRVPAGPRGPLPDESEMLGVALAGTQGGAAGAKRTLDVILEGVGRRENRLVAATAPGLHPTRTARILLGDEVVGHVGEVDPEVGAGFGIDVRVGWIEMDLGRVLPSERVYGQAVMVSRLPSSDIDLAFVVADEVPAAAVGSTISEAAGPLLAGLRLFDVYRSERLGPGRRSLAYRLRLQAADRTLTDADVAEVRRRCIDAVEADHGGRLRG